MSKTIEETNKALVLEAFDALFNKRISVTPLKLDLTDEVSAARYAQVFKARSAE